MTDNWAIQISPRVGDALINLRAETGEQMLSILSWYEQNATTIASAIQGVQAGAVVAGAFPGSQNVAPQGQGWENAAPGQQQWGSAPQGPPPAFAPQQAAPQQQAAPGPSCVHGPMVPRSGVGKTGKPWSAHMCPTPKGSPGQCDPVWG